MKKILTIKTNAEGMVDITSRVPDFMTEEEVNERLTNALPMAVAGLAHERSEGSILAARADILAMFEKADTMLTLMFCDKEDDCGDAGYPEATGLPDDRP